MPQPLYVFDAQVIDRASYGIGLAPKRITNTIRKRIFVERNKFVGRRKGQKGPKLGSFTRKVLKIKRRTREGTMPIEIASVFKGFMKMVLPDSLDRDVAQMGILSTHSPFTRGLVEMLTGDTTHTSGKFMPVPSYKNLEKIGITNQFYRAFRDMAKADELTYIRTGGVLLWVSKQMIEEGHDLKDSVLFVGLKRVRIARFNFEFLEAFDKTWPGMMSRMQKAVDREIRSINKGYAKPK